MSLTIPFAILPLLINSTVRERSNAASNELESSAYLDIFILSYRYSAEADSPLIPRHDLPGSGVV